MSYKITVWKRFSGLFWEILTIYQIFRKILIFRNIAKYSYYYYICSWFNSDAFISDDIEFQSCMLEFENENLNVCKSATMTAFLWSVISPFALWFDVRKIFYSVVLCTKGLSLNQVNISNTLTMDHFY